MLPNGGAFCAPVKTQLGIDVKQQYHILVTWSILRSPYKVFRVQFSIPYFIIAEFASTLPCLSRDRKPVNYRRARAAFWDGSVAVQNRIHSSKTYSKNNRGETSLCILYPEPQPFHQLLVYYIYHAGSVQDLVSVKLFAMIVMR